MSSALVTRYMRSMGAYRASICVTCVTQFPPDSPLDECPKGRHPGRCSGYTRNHMIRLPLVILLALALVAAALAQPYDAALFNGMRYRLIGPFRGGRAIAVAGVPGQLEKFYFGAVGGGVWETGNSGRTWRPIFDHITQASIGAIAVAPSDPNVIYVGTGEADMRSDIQQGDGMYRSTDAGKTWTHIGLTDTRQIGKILVDPRDSKVVYVAALGHQYGPNEERGVFKSTDGGTTWSKVLYKGPDVGAICLAMDPKDPLKIYAALWSTRRPPWSVYPPSNGPGSGLFKSADGGLTWTQVRGGGFPSFVGRVGIAIAPTDPNRIYAVLDSNDEKKGGIYRSDDQGVTWSQTNSDGRLWGRGWYFEEIGVDPMDKDRVYVMNTSTYRSSNGGRTFEALKGAPGGDDYHSIWIQPSDPTHIILGSDQGVVVSVDGGTSWSSWYNQPTAQLYHIVTDNRFPYWVYGSQQDSGAIAVPSRTIHTGVSALYGRPIDAGGESGTIAPDFLNPGFLLSTNGKEQLLTGWEQNEDPTLGHLETEWRNEWTQPIVGSPVNRRVFYQSHQKVFRTSDSGNSWQIISPDLTRAKTAIPLNLNPATAADNDGSASKGVVYWLAPSPIKLGTLWAGTDDGLIWLTRDDGVHWANVTPPSLTDWAKVGIIDASHFSLDTAYAAIDRHRLDDNHPYIYRTHDGGAHWQSIITGLPENQFVNVVREDPKCAGLLYAGTDWGVFVSFDDGDHWQQLQLNLPAASVRDIAFGGDDVVVGTHGRSIWVLDDVSRLRQMKGSKPGLFRPADACLFQRAGTFGFGAFDEGTPLPPEEPQGENPAWGAVLDYVLDGNDPVVLALSDSAGKVVRTISSQDKVDIVDPVGLSIPSYWIKPPQTLQTGPGGHRYVWDLRHSRGPLLPPGLYRVTLSNGSKTFTQPLRIVRDPRVSATDADLREQFRFALEVQDEIARVQATLGRAAKLSPSARRLKAVADGLASLEGAITSAPSAPILQYRQAWETLKPMAEKEIAELDRSK